MHPFAKLVRNPLVILAATKEVVELNPLAARLLGDPASVEEAFPTGEALEALLRRAAGSSEPALGALDVRTREGVRRFRVSALALRGTEEGYAIEIRESDASAFALLTKRVRELNDEVAERRRAQAQLEEALAQNRLLYRELQHRVKNHLQMMLALVSAAGRESHDPGQVAFIRMLHGKLSALFDAQRLMYAEASAEGVRADQMLHSIAETVQSLSTDKVTVQVKADPLVVPNDVAFPVALIANELLTNAAKYGVPQGLGRVVARLERRGPDIVLEVRDPGPGFTLPASGRNSSGLGLVLGLCRQIGGRLEIARDEGAVVTVSFPAPEALHVVC